MTKIIIKRTVQSNEQIPPLLSSIRLTNLLSFGPDTPEISLGPLNILIGPNGSGKSNFIEAISLLRSSVASLADITRMGGGVREWIWKGHPNSSATIDAVIGNAGSNPALRHLIQFTSEQQVFRLTDEVIAEYRDTEDENNVAEPNESLIPSARDRVRNIIGLGENEEDDDEPALFYEFKRGQPRIWVDGKRLKVPTDSFELVDSVLAQRRDPERYPEITYLAEQYGRIRLYREWQFGRKTPLRAPQPADMRTQRLEEDFSNLGLFLNRLQRDPQAKRTLLSYLRDIYEGVDDFGVEIEGGTVQVYFTEGDFTVPAVRLSDGTLRYLCLLAILCDPNPPPLICIEEPELGLHPDIIPKIADLLVEASTRTQLIVTTHSEVLVDAMTDRPDAIIICEKHDGQTEMKRLDPEEMKVWLEEYRVGEKKYRLGEAKIP